VLSVGFSINACCNVAIFPFLYRGDIIEPETMADTHKAARILRRMYTKLVDAYGPQFWWPGETRLEIIVGAYLTQNTSWRAVERSIANLKNQGLLTQQGLLEVSEEELRHCIRPSGFMVRKAAAIKAVIAFLEDRYGGSLDHLAAQKTATIREQLLALPGVGPETADALLLYALGHPVMVVDEYLRRVTTRHGLIQDSVPYAEIQRLSLDAFAQDEEDTLVQHYNEFHALVVELGKRHCRREPQCEGCPLNEPFFHPPAKMLRSKAAKK
jgi:endonuclease III related protein